MAVKGANMKKKLLAGALALLVLLGFVTTGWAGSQYDPLISLSYLTGTFFGGLKEYVAQWVAQDTQELEAGTWEIPGPEDGWTTSSGFVPGEVEYGETVILAGGSGLIWTGGIGSVSSGLLVDATTGTVLAEGKTLTAGHRYLADEETVVVTSSRSAQWMAEGKWRCGERGSVFIPLPFTDVPEGAWYYDHVRFAWEHNLVSGVSETLFSPNTAMERSMAAVLLYHLAGNPEVSYAPIFDDVPEGQWYANATVWCAQKGIVSGIGNGQFGPAVIVTRQQMAVMLYNYAIMMGWTADERGDLSAFPDGGTVASWAETGMSWAVGAYIFGGNDQGMLMPDVETDRAQMVTIFRHFMSWLDAQDS